ncbi:MAG: MASE1 domain-containing protein [Bacteroidota bacterium]
MVRTLTAYTNGRSVLLMLLTGVVYFVSARLGLLLAFEHTNATPVWPPSGIALAAMLLFGHRVWPGILLGALLANMYVFHSNQAAELPVITAMSAFISVGNTLEAVCGWYLIRRYIPGNRIFVQTGHTFIFILIVLIACLVSSAVGPLAVSMAHVVSWGDYPLVWFTWWLGDVTGMLVFAPLLLAWSKPLRFNWSWRKRAEVAAAYLLVLCIGSIVFLCDSSSDLMFVQPYVLICLLVLAAFRLPHRELFTCLLFISFITVWGTIRDMGVFASVSQHEGLVAAQLFVLIMAITILSAKAAIDERRHAVDSLTEAHRELQRLMAERTNNLELSRKRLAEQQRRMEDLLAVMLKNTILDFSARAPVSEKGDELDALAVGLNTMAEELESYITRLKDSEERYRLVVENVKDYAIFMIDPQGYVLTWNEGARNIKGYSAEEVIGRHFSLFYTKEEIERNEPEYNLKMAMKHGRFETESLRVKKDGSLFFADIVYTPLYDSAGNLEGFTKITRDITEKKRAEEKIIRLNVELEQNIAQLEMANKELESFSYSVSHDLRAPLRAIHGYTKILSEEHKASLNEDARRMMDSVMANAVRMGKLIDELLAFSRLGRKELVKERIDMEALAKEALREVKEARPEHKADIRIGKLAPAHADPALVRQVLINLLSNAVKFSHAVSSPAVEIGSYTEKGEIVYFVRDNGVGFDMKYYNKLFGVFQRLHAREEFEGTGVGLAIVKRIITRHGGRIWAESKPGEGAVFYFTLPNGKAD